MLPHCSLWSIDGNGGKKNLHTAVVSQKSDREGACGFEARFLNLGNIDLLGLPILCCGRLAVHCKMVSIPGLCPFHAGGNTLTHTHTLNRNATE